MQIEWKINLISGLETCIGRATGEIISRFTGDSLADALGLVKWSWWLTGKCPWIGKVKLITSELTIGFTDGSRTCRLHFRIFWSWNLFEMIPAPSKREFKQPHELQSLFFSAYWDLLHWIFFIFSIEGITSIFLWVLALDWPILRQTKKIIV